jgi:phosphoglycolate phosphatase
MIFLFDIDGTLLLSGGAGRVALQRAMDELLPVTGAMDRVTCAGKTDRGIIEEACRAALGREPADDLVQRIRDGYTAFLPGELADNLSFRLMPGVPQVLHALRRRKRTWLAVATGNIEPGARAKLQRAKLDHLFDVGGYGGDHRERTGILRDALQATARHANMSLDQMGPVIVVGDTVRDIEAAQALGLHVAVLADTTTPMELLQEADPDVIVEDLMELLPWSHKLRGKSRA